MNTGYHLKLVKLSEAYYSSKDKHSLQYNSYFICGLPSFLLTFGFRRAHSLIWPCSYFCQKSACLS